MNIRNSITPYYRISEDLDHLHKNYQGRIIKLCSNESILGANPNVMIALQKEIDKIHLYPNPESAAIKKIIATQLNLDPGSIIFGNGSTELIELATQELFLQDGNAVISLYSYPLYEMLVKKYNGTVRVVPMNNWEIDLTKFLNQIDHQTKAIYLASPNNPTGSWVAFEDLERFIKQIPKNIMLIIDEAYGEYLEGDPGYASLVPLTQRYNNLMVTKTFSKVYGLAGLRIGYAIANNEFIQKIRRRKQSANVNMMAQIAAIIAYQDTDYKNKVIFEVKKSLQLLTKKLAELNIEFISKSTNFLLVKTAKHSLQIYKELLKYGIVVQPMDFYNLPEYIRISIGKKEDMVYLLSIMPEILQDE